MAKKMTREEILKYVSPKREEFNHLKEEKDKMTQRLTEYDEEIEGLGKAEEEAKAKSGEEIAAAIKAGKDLTTFKTEASKELKKQRDDLHREKEEAEEAILILERLIEETELECLEDEITILREAQEKYLDDFEKDAKEFCDKWDLLKIERRSADGNFAYELDLRLDGLRVRRANINNARRDRELRKRKADEKKKLIAEGWTEKEFSRTVKYGPLIAPGIESMRK